MTKTLKTKTKTLTVPTARKAAQAYEDMLFSDPKLVEDWDYLPCYRKAEYEKAKVDFRSALGLPEDFRLTDKRMNNISDDLMAVNDSYTATSQRICATLLADTLYTLKWPTAYAKPMQKYFVLKG